MGIINQSINSDGHCFSKHRYITYLTFTPEDVIVKSLKDLKHTIKVTTNHKGKNGDTGENGRAIQYRAKKSNGQRQEDATCK